MDQNACSRPPPSTSSILYTLAVITKNLSQSASEEFCWWRGSSRGAHSLRDHCRTWHKDTARRLEGEGTVLNSSTKKTFGPNGRKAWRLFAGAFAYSLLIPRWKRSLPWWKHLPLPEPLLQAQELYHQRKFIRAAVWLRLHSCAQLLVRSCSYTTACMSKPSTKEVTQWPFPACYGFHAHDAPSAALLLPPPQTGSKEKETGWEQRESFPTMCWKLGSTGWLLGKLTARANQAWLNCLQPFNQIRKPEIKPCVQQTETWLVPGSVSNQTSWFWKKSKWYSFHMSVLLLLPLSFYSASPSCLILPVLLWIWPPN